MFKMRKFFMVGEALFAFVSLLFIAIVGIFYAVPVVRLILILWDEGFDNVYQYLSLENVLVILGVTLFIGVIILLHIQYTLYRLFLLLYGKVLREEKKTE